MGDDDLPPLRASTKQTNFELYESKWRKVDCKAELKIQEVLTLCTHTLGFILDMWSTRSCCTTLQTTLRACVPSLSLCITSTVTIVFKTTSAMPAQIQIARIRQSLTRTACVSL